MNAIEIKGLTKKYKDLVAVDGLDLEIEKGELFSLLGVNGAGKTTTIKMLSCLTKPDGGDALLNGFSIKSQSSEIKKIIGVSPQETAVGRKLSVRENLELMCGVYGLDKAKTKAKIDEIVEDFSLNEIIDKRAFKLSGGWQRRLSIAMALIGEPEILFLDEPTLGLDVIARSELWDIIESLKGKITIILTTHYMEEAEALSDRIAIMKDGKFLTVGTPQEIKDSTEESNIEKAFIKIVRGAKQ